MSKKSDIFIYDVYGIDPIPVKKILRILKPVLINYKIRDKKFMFVNLREPRTDTLWMKVTDLQEALFFERTRLDKPHTIIIPSPRCVGCKICNP